MYRDIPHIAKGRRGKGPRTKRQRNEYRARIEQQRQEEYANRAKKAQEKGNKGNG